MSPCPTYWFRSRFSFPSARLTRATSADGVSTGGQVELAGELAGLRMAAQSDRPIGRLKYRPPGWRPPSHPQRAPDARPSGPAPNSGSTSAERLAVLPPHDDRIVHRFERTRLRPVMPTVSCHGRVPPNPDSTEAIRGGDIRGAAAPGNRPGYSPGTRPEPPGRRAKVTNSASRSMLMIRYPAAPQP